MRRHEGDRPADRIPRNAVCRLVAACVPAACAAPPRARAATALPAAADTRGEEGGSCTAWAKRGAPAQSAHTCARRPAHEQRGGMCGSVRSRSLPSGRMTPRTPSRRGPPGHRRDLQRHGVRRASSKLDPWGVRSALVIGWSHQWSAERGESSVRARGAAAMWRREKGTAGVTEPSRAAAAPPFASRRARVL